MKRLSQACVLTAMHCSFSASALDATDFTPLYACPDPEPGTYCYWEQPVLGPSAQWIAYTEATTMAPWYDYWPHVVIRSRHGSLRYNITVDAEGRHHSPAWSRDGRSLALFVDSAASADGSLWLVDFLSVLASPSTPVASLLVESSQMLHASWSVDDSQIAYERRGQGIWSIASAGGVATQLVPMGHSPSWGPQDELVFEHQGDLWLRMASGDIVRRTQTSFDELTPAWSPQGDWIAYTSNEAGTWDIWIMGARGGSAVRVTFDKTRAVAPSWSADGKALTFMTLGGRDTIWLATQLPDWTTSVEQRGWGQVKKLYR